MATMKSLGRKTFYSAWSFSWNQTRRWVRTSSHQHIDMHVNALPDKYHRLVLQDRYCVKLRVSIERTSVRWRALCVVLVCLALNYSLPAHCSSLSCRGNEDRKGGFFSKICLAKWVKGGGVLCVISLWFGSLLCLTYSPFFCYACSCCCCCCSGCLGSCDGGGRLAATELSILTRMLMRSGQRGRVYGLGEDSIVGRAVRGNARGRDSEALIVGYCSSSSSPSTFSFHTGVCRTQGGKLGLLVR